MSQQLKFSKFQAFKVSPEQAEKIKQEASRLGLFQSQYIRNAIEYAIKNGFQGLV